MSIIRADSIKNRGGNGAPDFPNGLTVTGVITSTTLNANITGDLSVTGNLGVGGTVTYEDVSNVDSVGVITARSEIQVGSAVTANSGGVDTVGVVTATSFKNKAGGTLTPSPTTTQGDIIVRGASADGRLAIGAAGKALKVNSSANGLEYGDAGAWTKIASGSGPASAVTSITLDNIFSDSYTFYKIWYHWNQDDWMKGRYINADGTEYSSSSYGWVVNWAADNADGHDRSGTVNVNYMTFHYWDAADNSPGQCEITLTKPYSSSLETNNFWTGMQVHGTRIFTMQGANSDYTAGSRRGIKFYGSGGDAISSSNFHYLVLGANI